MNLLKNTRTAPAERRAGTYERDDDVTSVLRYRTHTIHDLPRERTLAKMGSDPECDIVLSGEYISREHLRLERRARGLVLVDTSKNGTYHETQRNVGRDLNVTFEDKRVSNDGHVLDPGSTFVVGEIPHRYIALDDAMRADHPTLVEILGREDEDRSTPDLGETASPSDLILAATGPGHMLITGEAGCEHESLARAIHRVSKRRDHPLVEISNIPSDRRAQSDILRQRSTILLNLGKSRHRIDPAFVDSMFSPSYQLRAIVIARTWNGARRALGHKHMQSLAHVWLRPLSLRRSSIHPLLDQWLEQHASPLRVADLTQQNRRALMACAWRKNLEALRETAVRLAAITRAGFSRKKAALALGIPRQTFYNWCGTTIGLSRPLVPQPRAAELIALVAERFGSPAEDVQTKHAAKPHT